MAVLCLNFGLKERTAALAEENLLGGTGYHFSFNSLGEAGALIG